MDKNIVFNQLFQSVFNQNFLNFLSESEVDKYVKKLATPKLIQLMVNAHLEQFKGLREISGCLNDPDWNQRIELASISHSQIARSLKKLSLSVLDEMFLQAKTQLGQKIGFQRIANHLGNLQLIDSTTVSLCLSGSPWALFRKTKGGVKIHLRLKFCDQQIAPDHFTITTAKVADRRQMDNLIVEDSDVIHVMDRGYIDYKQFDTMCENGIRFVTRLKENAIVETVSENSVPIDSPIRKDSLVYLGKGTKKMSHPLRLIETIDSQERLVRILTNEFQIESCYIGEIYRNRWQIEVFFKWIKQHLTIKHLYGKSQSAVEAQLYLALILYCLLQVLRLKTGYSKSLLEFVRILKIYLFESYESFLEKLRQHPSRKTKGRRKIDCENELIYRMTERQVMHELDAGQLYDLTYDPLFL
jgi:hypothetical protein